MILKSDCIAKRLEDGNLEYANDPLVVVPRPDINELQQSGSSSLDLRLGTWFVSLRQSRMPHMDINDLSTDLQLTKTHYVPFGEKYWLHPRAFVLGVTLEWMRMPTDIAGDVIGKSSWGRRGLIIATATGVHPGFKGCLTLELTNVGELPIAIYPGTTVCQLRLFNAQVLGGERADSSQFVGLRKPSLGEIRLDDMARNLSNVQNNK
jgi:dCTP deaminase